jgi:hypothetical protein
MTIGEILGQNSRIPISRSERIPITTPIRGHPMYTVMTAVSRWSSKFGMKNQSPSIRRRDPNTSQSRTMRIDISQSMKRKSQSTRRVLSINRSLNTLKKNLKERKSLKERSQSHMVKSNILTNMEKMETSNMMMMTSI